MAKESLGQLPNAPLAYVLGAVKFEPQLALEKHIPALQERLQSKFPRFRPVNEAVIQLSIGDSPLSQSPQRVRFEFASADNRRGIILNLETLVFHATAYTTYNDFGARLSEVLTDVGAELKHLFVRRIGLRYIDTLIPEEGETPDDYVSSDLRCLPKLSLPLRARSGLAISEFQMEKGALVVRYAAGPGRLGLPPDLQPLPLTESAVMQRPIPENVMSGLLDFDRFMPQEALFNAVQIRRWFDELHDDLSIAFRELTTEHAKRVWQQEPQQ